MTDRFEVEEVIAEAILRDGEGQHKRLSAAPTWQQKQLRGCAVEVFDALEREGFRVVNEREESDE